MNISVIIPTLNEEESLEFVMSAVPHRQVDEILVIDGGSTDNTVAIAEAAGARVIHEGRRGYGQACFTGTMHAKGEIVVFLDADGADDPAGIPKLVEPLLANRADMVLGSRLAGTIAEGAMPWHQRFGNWLSAGLIRMLYGLSITDLSPFRAVRKRMLLDLGMTEMTYGWPTEMIAKAARRNWRILELPVDYRPRYGGKSKISGTVRGTVLATYFIISTIFKFAIKAENEHQREAETSEIEISASPPPLESIVIIMAKEPKIGSTKTRLCPPLSLEEAAQLYEALLRDTIDMSARLEGIHLGIAITPPESFDYFDRITPLGTHLLPVICKNIGDCLNQVLNQLLDRGFRKAIALNGDGPSLPPEYIFSAFRLLDNHDVVFGPSEDGGYYLVGIKAPTPEIFTGVEWSTSKVLDQSLAKAEAQGKTVALTPKWYDVDTIKDIERLRQELDELPPDRLIHCRNYFQNE